MARLLTNNEASTARSDHPSLAALESYYQQLAMPAETKQLVLRRIEHGEIRRRRRGGWWVGLAIAFGVSTAIAATVTTRHFFTNEREAFLSAVPEPTPQADAPSSQLRKPARRLPTTEPPAQTRSQGLVEARDVTVSGDRPRRKARVAKRRRSRTQHVPAPRRVNSSPSALTRELAAYHAALKLAAHDDRQAITLRRSAGGPYGKQTLCPTCGAHPPGLRQALASWRRMQNEFPNGTLRHEVDLRVIETLLRLGRRDEARRAARALLRRFPRSSRAADLRELAVGKKQ